MSMLFPEDPFVPVIPGLIFSPGFISPAEERELVEAIDREPWDHSWDRRRQSYGASYGRGPSRAANSVLGKGARLQNL